MKRSTRKALTHLAILFTYVLTGLPIMTGATSAPNAQQVAGNSDAPWPTEEASAVRYVLKDSGGVSGTLQNQSGDSSVAFRLWKPKPNQIFLKIETASGFRHGPGGVPESVIAMQDVQNQMLELQINNKGKWMVLDAKAPANAGMSFVSDLMVDHVIPLVTYLPPADQKLAPSKGWLESHAARLVFLPAFDDQQLNWRCAEEVPGTTLVRLHGEASVSRPVNTGRGKEYMMEQYAADVLYDTKLKRVRSVEDTYDRQWWESGAASQGEMIERQSHSWMLTELPQSTTVRKASP